jgi:hypothetical protein
MHELDPMAVGTNEPISRRSLFGRSAALAGTAVAGSALVPGSRLLAPAKALAAGESLELIKLNTTDMSLTPERFAASGPGGALGSGWVWGFIQDNPTSPKAKPPIYIYRNYTAAASPGKRISVMSDDITGYATGLHCDRLTGPSASPYTTVTGDPTGLTNDPTTYQFGVPGATGYQYNFSSKHTKIREGDVLEATFDHFPYALCVNPPSVAGPDAFKISPWFVQFGVAKGRYNGRRVRFLGGTERLFAGAFAQLGDPTQFFAGGYFVGEHPDGSHESAFILLLFRDLGGTNGNVELVNSMAFYVKERGGRKDDHDHHRNGRHRHRQPKLEVVTSRDVHGEIHYKKLAWKDAPVISRAKYRFGGKEIDFRPRWGFNGGDTCLGPASNSVGQSYGPWREKRSSGNFELNLTYSESTATSARVNYSAPTVF